MITKVAWHSQSVSISFEGILVLSSAIMVTWTSYVTGKTVVPLVFGTTLTYHKHFLVMNLSYFTIERVFTSRIIHLTSESLKNWFKPVHDRSKMGNER